MQAFGIVNDIYIVIPNPKTRKLSLVLDTEEENVLSCLQEVYHLTDEPCPSRRNQIFPQTFTAEL